MTTSKKEKKKFYTLGNILIIAALLILLLIFAPVVKEETKYNFNATRQTIGEVLNLEVIEPKLVGPPNTDFSIVVPKISAAAPVIANVDSQIPNEYLKALRRGVAHAEGTALPDESGNVYLFAHSTDAFYNVGYYNAVFYLLNKLVVDDEIFIYYNKEKFVYKVKEKRVVNPGDVKYLGKIGEGNTLTLQTCYPPGTTLKRLVVVADKVSVEKI